MTPTCTRAASSRHAALLALALVLAPAATEAQNTAPTAAHPWDVAGLVALVASRPETPDQPGYHDTWLHAGGGALVVGRHLSPHLKLDVELGAAADGRQYLQLPVAVPGLVERLYRPAERFVSHREIGAAVTWQFLDNQWIHPFVQGGFTADVERTRLRTWPQTYFGSSSRPTIEIPADPLVTTSDLRVRAVIGGGAKWYVNPRAFIRSDARLALGATGQHLAFRLGFGVDF